MGKKLIILSLSIAIMIMCVAFALFNTNIKVNGTGQITSTWEVLFTGASKVSTVGEATEASAPIITGTTVGLNVNLVNPGDSITYNVVVFNNGTLPAKIQNIETISGGGTAIKYTISGINIGDKLAIHTTKTLTIKVEYDSTVTGQPANVNGNLTVNLIVAQDLS